MRLKFFIAVLLAAFTLSGCGDNGSDFVVTNTSSISTTTRPLNGKLFLGKPAGGVPITVVGPDGAVLASGSTDGSGNFTIGSPLPPAFRVQAALNDQLVFAREVRNFDTENTFASITVPTTLVSLLAQASPNQPLEALEAQVRESLAMPNGSYLGATAENVAYGFSHIDFFGEAAIHGGVRSYIEEVVASGEPPNEAPFLLRQDSYEANFAGSEPEVAAVVLPLSTQDQTYLSTTRLISRGVNNTVVGALGFKGGLPQVNLPPSGSVLTQADIGLDIIGDTLGSLGKAVGSAIIGQVTTVGTQAGYTWVAEQLGGHFGTAVELDEILNDLVAIQSDLALILGTIEQATLDTELASMLGWSNDITAVQNSLVEGLDDAKKDGDYFNDEPGPISPTVESTVEAFKASTIISRLEGDINNLALYMTGASLPSASGQIEYPPITVSTSSNSESGSVNVLTSMRTLVLNQNGVVPTSASQQFANFPVRSSVFLDQILAPFEGHARSLVLGANMMGEAGHQSLSPTTDIPKAQAYADNVAKSLQNIRAQLPGYPLSDNYFIDLENGLMWYMVVQAPTDTASAQSAAESFNGDEGITGGWRLPSWDELKSLQVRAAWAASAGASFDTDDTVVGLQQLGFDTTNLTDYVNGADNGGPAVLAANWTYNNGLGTNQWNLQSDTPLIGLLTENLFDKSPVDTGIHTSYIMCRTLGTTPCIDINPPLIAGGTNPGSWPSAFNGQPQAEEEASVAMPTSLGTVSVNNGVVTFSDVTWDFITGASGGYTVGNGGTASSTYSTTYDRSVSYTSATSVPPVYFQTVDSAGVSVSSYPYNFGVITPHVNSNITTTIDLYSLGFVNNVYPSILSTSTTYSTPSPTQITLDTLQITPRNQTVDLSSSLSASRFFLAVGFYSDQTTADLSSEVTWTATDASTGQPAAGVTFIESGGKPTGEISFNRSAPPLINLSATINTTSGNPTNVGTDTTKIAVTLP